MADPNFEPKQTDKSARASDAIDVQKPGRAGTDARKESGAEESTASRPRGKTEDPDKTL
jgi:hypothetical protein